MRPPRCLRTDDGASYVLGAMPDDEAEAFRYHLGECEECAVTLRELEFVSHALRSGVPQLTAPPQIRDRVMRTVHAEAQLLQSAGADADADRGERARSRKGRFSLRPLPSIAIAAVLLALGLTTGKLLSGEDGAPSLRTIAAHRVPAGATAEMRLSSDGAKLVVSGMRAPASGRVYQVWLDRPNDRQPPLPTKALFSVNKHGEGSVDVPGRLAGVSQVLVTSEPLTGSEIPSRQPIITVGI
jgi:anti-sigma factor RsiW